MSPWLACAALALGLFAAPVSAQSTAALSAELYLAGREARDPLLLLAAAKLRKSVLLEPVERTPEKDMPLPEAVTAEAPLGWQEMLDAALALAPEDPAITQLAEDIAAESSRGVKTGQLYSITAIRNGGTDTYPPLTYRGGEYADVYVEGSGQADLNLFVYDAQARLVCSDTDISAIAHCGWTPAQDAAFTVVVRNRGRSDSGYSLITN